VLGMIRGRGASVVLRVGFVRSARDRSLLHTAHVISLVRRLPAEIVPLDADARHMRLELSASHWPSTGAANHPKHRQTASVQSCDIAAIASGFEHVGRYKP
jgi:hypothetical protein